MRARNKMYHPDCFSCESCSRQLVSGDEFALKDDHVFCKVCIRINFPSSRHSPSSHHHFLIENDINSQTDHEVFEKGSGHHYLQDLSSPPPPGMTDADISGNSVSPLSNSNSSINSGTGSTGNSNHGPSNKMQLTGNATRVVQDRISFSFLLFPFPFFVSPNACCHNVFSPVGHFFLFVNLFFPSSSQYSVGRVNIVFP